METVFSGIQPSDELHLGNYLGAVRNGVALPSNYQCFYCIVDDHAIAQTDEPTEMSRRVREMAADVIACGVVPDRAVQSEVPAPTDLVWVLASLTPHGELERMTPFKDKSQRQRVRPQMAFGRSRGDEGCTRSASLPLRRGAQL